MQATAEFRAWHVRFNAERGDTTSPEWQVWEGSRGLSGKTVANRMVMIHESRFSSLIAQLFPHFVLEVLQNPIQFY
jgi:hypothetical protein